MPYQHPMRHCKTDDDKTKFKRSLGAAQTILEDILDQTITTYKQMDSSGGMDQYNCANWGALQAHRNGKKQQCEELIRFLEGLTKGED